MQAKNERKEAVRQFKERKTLLGAFAMRCTASGQVWVGTSRNLDATRNSFWFSLRHGACLDKSLQAEWDAHGEAAFEYQVLETLDEDVQPLAVKDLLAAKRQHWLTELGAKPTLNL